MAINQVHTINKYQPAIANGSEYKYGAASDTNEDSAPRRSMKKHVTEQRYKMDVFYELMF
jgi:hypothetical protein